MEGWYTIFTKPRRELQAEENLRRQDFRCFLPQIQQIRRRRGNRYVSIEALFPRYLFIRINPFQDNIAPIRSTLGVTGMVRFGYQLPVVPDAFIEALMNVADPLSGLIKLEQPDLVKGDRVVVEEGPLMGVQGVFQAATSKERVIILLDMLGKQNTVILPRDTVAKVI